jgi:AcrR family transcriptional regulator
VAELAGVNSSLVRRYFGSKHGLYRAVLEQVLDFSPMFLGDRGRFGVDMVAALLDESHDAPGPLSMMILSMADPEAHAMSVELLHAKVLGPLGKWLGAPDGEARAARLNILCTGFLINWKLLPNPSLSDAGISDATRHWLEVSIQALVD